MKNIVIVTHDGTFHIDEIVAIALVQLIFEEFTFTIKRTRDEDAFKDAHIVIDVGEKYDSQRFFDHHQFSKTDDEYGYSSAGLVFKHIKPILKDIYYRDKILVLEEFIKAVDGRDTFVNYNRNGKWVKLFDSISNYNCVKVNSPEQESRFNETLEDIKNLIIELIREDKDKVNQIVSFIRLKGNIYKHTRDVEIKKRLDNSSSIKIKNFNFLLTKEGYGLHDVSKNIDGIIIVKEKEKKIKVLVKTDKGVFVSSVKSENEKFIHTNGFIGVYKLDNLEEFKFCLNNEVVNINLNKELKCI